MKPTSIRCRPNSAPLWLAFSRFHHPISSYTANGHPRPAHSSISPHYLRSGLAQNVLRDLRRGRWVTQDEIDLHGLNRDEARHLLASFLAECLHHGKRCVRVVHGKGLGSPQKMSILRQLVRGWLAQRQEVLAYCQAKPPDGGEGALIVLLRNQK